MKNKKFLITTFIMIFNMISFAQTYDCYDCSCGSGKGTYWDLQDCLDNCVVSLGCFTGICAAIEMPGRRPGVFEATSQIYWFELDMECYSVTGDRDQKYNCIGWVTGNLDKWIWDEIDAVYGDMDGKVEVIDFDSFFASGGYTPSSSCDQVSGYEKIVLYGKLQADGTIKLTHAAKQSDFDGGTSDWWESKEGNFKRIIHHINDLSNEYGDVVRCYEKQL